MTSLFINRWLLGLTFNQGKIGKHFTVDCAFDSLFGITDENAGQYLCGFCFFFFNYLIERVFLWFLVLFGIVI